MKVSSLSLLASLCLALTIGSCRARTDSQTSPEWASLAEVAMKSVCEVEILETKTGVPVLRSMGTGFLISSDGYLLTNAHVVDSILTLNNPAIQVRFENGKEYEVLRTIMLPDLDIAILKIDGKNLPYLELEFRDKLQRGDHLLSLGNPYPFTFSVSAGIVSGLKFQSNPKNKFLWVQSDLGINPGMSGGPVIGVTGKVVAINQAYVPEMSEVSLLIPVTSLKGYFMAMFPKYLTD